MRTGSSKALHRSCTSVIWCLRWAASSVKRAEHIFPEADEVRALLSREGFEQVKVSTIAKQIKFPSLLD
jgi:hypothetical protein